MANKITDMGIVRPLDSIGRLMIPIEARRELGITPGDKVHIYLDNGKVVVEKYKKYVKEYRKYKEQYQSKYGPICSLDNDSDVFEYMRCPWPWEGTK